MAPFFFFFYSLRKIPGIFQFSAKQKIHVAHHVIINYISCRTFGQILSTLQPGFQSNRWKLSPAIPNTSFGKMTLPSVACFCADFTRKLRRVFQKIWLSDDSIEGIILHLFVTQIGLSCAESYSAEFHNYFLLLCMTS